MVLGLLVACSMPASLHAQAPDLSVVPPSQWVESFIEDGAFAAYPAHALYRGGCPEDEPWRRAVLDAFLEADLSLSRTNGLAYALGGLYEQCGTPEALSWILEAVHRVARSDAGSLHLAFLFEAIPVEAGREDVILDVLVDTTLRTEMRNTAGAVLRKQYSLDEAHLALAAALARGPVPYIWAEETVLFLRSRNPAGLFPLLASRLRADPSLLVRDFELYWSASWHLRGDGAPRYPGGVELRQLITELADADETEPDTKQRAKRILGLLRSNED